MQSVAHAIARPLWQIEDLHEIADLLALVPRDPHAFDNYLFDQLDKAQAEHAANQRLRAGHTGRGFPDTCHDEQRQLRNVMRLAVSSPGLPIEIGGQRLDSADVELNTTLRIGNDVIRLVAKLGGWGASHAWVQGEHRAWMADLVDQGLQDGVLRAGLWYVDGPCDGLPENHPQRRWRDLGWGAVTAFLRERDDEPVVTSYSCDDDFPGPSIAGWYEDEDGGYDAWDRLPAREKWDRSMAGLARRRPWAQLESDTLGYYTFGVGATLFDLYAPDRDERVRALAGAQ